MSRLVSGLGVFLIIAAALAGLYFSGYLVGKNSADARWEQREEQAKNEKERIEKEWADKLNASEARQAKAEKDFADHQKRMDAAWQDLLRGISGCTALPPLGLHLNDALGVPRPPGVAGAPAPNRPDTP